MSGRVAADLIIRRAAQLWTGEGARPASTALENGALAAHRGQIVWVGSDAEIGAAVALVDGARSLDAAGCVVTPGFVDCHTHLVFAGSRAAEHGARCAGASYLEIAALGGGIASTVRATRAASEEALVALALPRLRRLLEFGVTTAEVKSGYGLDLESELKSLRAIRRLGELQPIETVPTLMCAHAIPPEFQGDRAGYLELCLQEIIPAAAALGGVRFCDAFVDAGAFSVDEARRVFRRAMDAGMRPRLHADQLASVGALGLALELGAVSVDHLEAIEAADIERLARSQTAAVLLPTSTLFLRDHRRAPGRRLLDAGARVALATNLNPGTAMSENAALTLGLACLFNGLTPEEALTAFTRGAADVLGLGQRVGVLAPGFQADVAIHAAPDVAHLAWHLGVSHVRTVVKRGEIAFHRELAPCG